MTFRPLPVGELLSSLDPGEVVVAGDWHGNTEFAVAAIERAAAAGHGVMLHVGDFAFRFQRRFLEAVDEALDRHGMHLLFVRGNHDSTSELGDLPAPDADLTQRVADRIRFLPDGTRWTWQGRSWVAVGGAPSIDRAMRVPGVSWWPDEVLDPAVAARIIADGPVDAVLAHDAPDRVEIPGIMDSSWLPSECAARCRSHRQLLGEVADGVRPELWVHGHYHVRYRERRGPMTVAGLDADVNGSVDASLVVVSTGTLRVRQIG